MITSNVKGFVVTRCARRNTRLVCGADAHLTHLKAAGNRRARRVDGENLAKGKYDWAPRKVTGWDVS